MNQAERVVQRRNTDALIEHAEVEVQLWRAERRPKANGGYVTDPPVPVAFQRVGLFRSRPTTPITTAGRMHRVYDRMVGPPTADILAGDEFEHDDIKYEVTRVVRRTYEVSAGINQRSGQVL